MHHSWGEPALRLRTDPLMDPTITTNQQTLTDITEEFEFLEETVTYIDAPLDGFVRNRSGELFAFQRVTVVADAIWHWALVPARSDTLRVADVFRVAREAKSVDWISGLEDARFEPTKLTLAGSTP